MPASEWKDFFRNCLRVEKHEISNSYLIRLYRILTEDEPHRKVVLEDFNSFLDKWVYSLDDENSRVRSFAPGIFQPGKTPMSMTWIGPMGPFVPLASLESPKGGNAVVPFNLQGRGGPSRNRLAASHIMEWLRHQWMASAVERTL